jgi:hypothetical protein
VISISRSKPGRRGQIVSPRRPVAHNVADELGGGVCVGGGGGGGDGGGGSTEMCECESGGGEGDRLGERSISEYGCIIRHDV